MKITNELVQAFLAIAISLSSLAFFRGRPSKHSEVFSVATTLVPSDIVDLACDAAPAVGGERCAFAGGHPDATLKHPLRPFVTLDREVILLRGVFESPAVAARVSAARRAGSKETLTLDCRVKFLGLLAEAGVRWREGDAFSRQRELRVGAVKDCQLRVPN